MRYCYPPCANPAPVGGGGACDASVLPVQKNPVFLCTGNTTLSQPGRPSGGAEPLERQAILNNFYRAVFFSIHHYNQSILLKNQWLIVPGYFHAFSWCSLIALRHCLI